MSNNRSKKICIVATSLSKGGAERSSALLSKMLHNLNYTVHIVTVLDDVDYDYKGKLLNLGKLKNKSNSMFNQIHRFKVLWTYLRNENFDYIIDNRTRVEGLKEYLISKLLYRAKTIYVIHSNESSVTFPKSKWLSKMIYQNEQMTAVSKAIKTKFQSCFNLKHIKTIHNAFDFESINLKSLESANIPKNDYIIFCGRLDDYQKNIKLLLDAFQNSRLIKNNVKLLLLGDGLDKTMLQQYARELNIQDEVTFKGYVKNPYAYIKSAKFLVLTSRFEGFPMVIPEALSLGIPVVSVNCKSGPNEIIINEHNGLLVDNHDISALSQAMDRMMYEDQLLLQCGNDAKESVDHLSMAVISKEWDNFLKAL